MSGFAEVKESISGKDHSTKDDGDDSGELETLVS